MTLSLRREKIKILLLEGVHENAVEYFRGRGYENIKYYKKALEEKELLAEIENTHLIGIRSRTQLTEKVLKSAKKLIAIGNFCIGTNQVDLNVAKKLGIPVFNAPYSNTRSVAELVIAESVFLMRGIPEKNALAHRGGWLKSAENSFEIRGKSIGIVGYGHIGSQVSILAEAMGMKVYYYDIENKLSIGNAKMCSSLKELLNISDVVTLHVPGTDLTREMIGQNEVAEMKKGSYLINASRGNVIVIDELKKALEKGDILGAAIDVFPTEPASKEEEFHSELRAFENVLITPHVGGSTQEAQQNIAFEVAEKLADYSDIGTTTSAVNFPRVQLPPNSQRCRFLHIHKNVPGVMEDIIKVFSSNNLNIAEQYLQTDSDVGYVVIGIDADKIESSIMEELNAIPNTIRARKLY